MVLSKGGLCIAVAAVLTASTGHRLSKTTDILKPLRLHLALHEFYPVASSSYEAVLSGGVAFAPVELLGLWSRRDPTWRALGGAASVIYYPCGNLKGILVL